MNSVFHDLFDFMQIATDNVFHNDDGMLDNNVLTKSNIQTLNSSLSENMS